MRNSTFDEMSELTLEQILEAIREIIAEADWQPEERYDDDFVVFDVGRVRCSTIDNVIWTTGFGA